MTEAPGAGANADVEQLAYDDVLLFRAYASADAHVIYGTACDDALGDSIRVTVVATVLSKQNARRTTVPLQADSPATSTAH